MSSQHIKMYKNNADIQEDLTKIENFIVSAIEEDFEPIKVKMFLDYDLQGEFFVGNFVGSNSIAYSFSIDENGIMTLTRR